MVSPILNYQDDVTVYRKVSYDTYKLYIYVYCFLPILWLAVFECILYFSDFLLSCWGLGRGEGGRV